jgi:hypothetical protein
MAVRAQDDSERARDCSSQKEVAAFCLLFYHPPPPPPENQLLPELEPGALVDEDIALENELPNEVAKLAAVMRFQAEPEYQPGEYSNVCPFAVCANAAANFSPHTFSTFNAIA